VAQAANWMQLLKLGGGVGPTAAPTTGEPPDPTEPAPFGGRLPLLD